MNKRLITYLIPPLLGLLVVFGICDLISLIQNFYYHQNRGLGDFIPGLGFYVAFSMVLIVAVILQFTLFRFLFRFERLFKYLITVLIVSIAVLVIIYYVNTFDFGAFLSLGFFIYSIVNYLIYKKLSSYTGFSL
jgi:hypothetical protein